MSQIIENQIVKMQFDNSGFEKGAQQSMSTLDKFKKMLHFDKVNMTPLQQAFSETEVTATKAGFHIRDIWLKVASTLEQQVADKIVDTGKKIFNALSLEGVTDGFKEYELKMGSIQTIMAGTGESLATVNKYLEDLNTYSDKTIYSFSDMTQNIGKFTNAGVKLKDAVNAIKGIANEAAVSGANATEASHAMYNFAQALSAGYVKLIDWKSIENANMATKEFKQTLLDVAAGLGTVVKVGEDYQTTTTNAQGKVSDLFNSTKMFNDSLNHQWMTTEVLTRALEIYATDVRELSESELKNYEDRLKNELHLSDEQVKAFERLGIKAADAATEIKTFTMLIDTLKEAIGSGWAMTWQYFIGDFEQAKALWTEVGQVLGGTIDKMSEARNSLVKAAMQTGWEKFTTMEKKAIPESEKFRNILVDIAEQHGVLTHKQAIEIASTEDLMKSFHELKWVTGDLLKESVSKYSETLSSMSKEEREAAGITEDMVSQFNDFKASMIGMTKNGKDPFDEMAESMNELGGRENIIQGLKNAFNSLKDAIAPIGEAFDNVFGVMDPKNLFNITERFREFTEQMKVSDDAANTIRTSFTLAFGGIKTILDAVSTAIKGVLKLVLPVFNLFDAIFGLIGKVVSALTGSKGALEAADKFTDIGDKIGDKYIAAMDKLAKFINKVADAIRGIPESTIFVKIHDGVIQATESVKDFINSFVEMPVIQQMITDFNNSIESIQKKMEPVIKYISKSLDETKKKIGAFFTWESFNKNLTIIYNGIKKVIDTVKGFAERIKNFFKNLKEGKSVVESFRDSFGDIIDKLKELKRDVIDFFDKLFAKGDEMGGKFNLEEIQQAIHEFVSNISADQITMLAVAGSFLLISLNLLKLSNALRNAVEAFTGIGVALKNVINSYVKKQKSAILQVAESIVIVAAALWVLSTIPKEKMDNAIKGMITIAAALGALTIALIAAGAILGSKGGPLALVQLASGLAAVAGSFLIAVAALKALEFVDLSLDLVTKIGLVTIILAGLMALSTLMAKLDKFSKGSLTLVAVSGSLLIASAALAEIGKIPADQLDKAMVTIGKLMAGMGLLAFGASKLGLFSAVGLIAIVLTFSKLMPAIENMVTYDYTKINEGLAQNETMLKKLGGLLLIMTAIGAVAGNRIKGAGIAFLAMSATFAILVGVAKLASMLKPSELAQGEQFIYKMAGVMALLELFSAKSRLGMWGGKDSEGSKVFIRIAETMLILLGIAKLASMMKPKDLIIGELALLGLAGIVAALVGVARIAKPAKGVIASIAGMLTGISMVLMMIAVLSIIPMEHFKTAIATVAGIMGALAVLAYAMSKNVTVYDKDTQRATGIWNTVAAAALVVVCGLLVYALAQQTPTNVAAAAAAIVGVTLAISVLATAISKMSAGAGINMNQLASIGLSLAAIYVIGAMIEALASNMGSMGISATQMLSAAGAITMVLLGLAPAMYIIGNMKGQKVAKGQIQRVVEALGALALVAVAVGALSRFGGDPKSMIASAIAMSIVLIAICAPIAVLGKVGQIINQHRANGMDKVIKGAVAILLAAAVAIGGLNNFGGNPDSLMKSAMALSTVLIAICFPIAILGAVGKFCGKENIPAMYGVMGAAILALGGIAVILGAFASLVDIDRLVQLNGAIPILITVMAGVSALAVALAFAGMTASVIPGSVGAAFGMMVVALAAFAGIVGEIIALGWLLNKFEGVSKGLDTGLKAMVKIFGMLGAAVGALIDNFAMAATNDLDTIADRLNSFAEKMVPFSENMSKVSKEALEGCANLAGAMLCLTASEFLDGIARFMGLGSPDFSFFKSLGDATKEFTESVKDISPDSIARASICAAVAKKLVEINSSLDKEGGWVGAIFGEKDLEGFGKAIKSFGRGLKIFCDEVSGLDASAVASAQNAADAAGPVITMSKSLVAHGGLLQKVLGEQDIAAFGESIKAFASTLIQFVTKLNVLERISPDYPTVIKKCADATTPLLDLAASIENSGGLLGKIVGNNDLDVFGKTLMPFVEDLYAFVLMLKTMSEDVPNYKNLIADCIEVCTGLIKLTKELENIHAVPVELEDSRVDRLDAFGKSLKKFGKSFEDYYKSIEEMDFEIMANANEAIKDLIETANLSSTMQEGAFGVLTSAVAGLSMAPISQLATTFGEEGITTLITQIGTMFDTLLQFVTTRTTTDYELYKAYGTGVIKGIVDGIMLNTYLVTFQALVMVTALRTYLNIAMSRQAYFYYGMNVALGIADGIRAYTDEAVSAATELASAVNEALHIVLEINSPSKVAYRVGRFFDMGLANGIEENTYMAVQSTETMAEGVIKSANTVISAISQAIDSNMDVQPTIRPVLDTSDIERKATRINSMFRSSDLNLAYNASGSINQAYNDRYSSDSTASGAAMQQINFTQNNYSPKALSRVDIYRDTKNQLSMMKGVVRANA